MEPDQTVTPNVSIRWARVLAFIEGVRILNEDNATEEGPRENEVILMTDFAQIRFNPNQEQSDDRFPRLVDVLEDAIIKKQAFNTEGADYKYDGPLLILPRACVTYHGSSQNIIVPGLVLFVDSVKAMTLGAVSIE